MKWADQANFSMFSIDLQIADKTIKIQNKFKDFINNIEKWVSLENKIL